jgi:hypothetical protein
MIIWRYSYRLFILARLKCGIGDYNLRHGRRRRCDPSQGWRVSSARIGVRQDITACLYCNKIRDLLLRLNTENIDWAVISYWEKNELLKCFT